MTLDPKSELTITTIVANGTYSADANSPTPVNISPLVGKVAFRGDFGAPYLSSGATLSAYIQTTGTLNPDSLQAPTEQAWRFAGTFTPVTSAAAQETISVDSKSLDKWVRANLDFGGVGNGARSVSVAMIGQNNNF